MFSVMAFASVGVGLMLDPYVYAHEKGVNVKSSHEKFTGVAAEFTRYWLRVGAAGGITDGELQEIQVPVEAGTVKYKRVS